MKKINGSVGKFIGLYAHSFTFFRDVWILSHEWLSHPIEKISQQVAFRGIRNAISQ